MLAGTEHNTLEHGPDRAPLRRGRPVPEDLKDIFWEGACVIAAHQFLTANGKSGYVDEHGEPDPSYPDAEARIKAFADLGAAVIEKYAGTALAHRRELSGRGLAHGPDFAIAALC